MDKPIKIIKEGLNSDKTPKPYPKSIMKTKKVTKIKPVSDPAKSPILKKNMRRHTIRILTNSGVHSRKLAIKHKIKKMSDEDVNSTIIKHGYSAQKRTPAESRKILGGLMMAGFVS